MKKLLITALLLAMIMPVSAQNNERNPVERTTIVQYLTRDRLLTFINSGPRPKGSVYLFDNWSNVGVIESVDGNKSISRNINFNIDAQQFEAKFNQDSVYQYDLENVRSVTLNNKKFIKLPQDGETKLYEQLVDINGLEILKLYGIKVYEGSYNPMVSRPADVYKKRKTYYLRNGDGLKEIKLNKKHLSRVLAIDEDRLNEHMKQNDLSWKNEIDVINMIKHLKST